MQAAEWLKQPYQKKKTAALFAGIFLLCSIGYILILFLINSRMKVTDVSGCRVPDDGTMSCAITGMDDEDGYLTICGYAYQPGISVDTARTEVLVCDDSGTYYTLPTENVKRKSLTEAAADGFNYDYAGFTAVIRHDRVQSGSRIYIRYRCNGFDLLLKTDQSIS